MNLTPSEVGFFTQIFANPDLIYEAIDSLSIRDMGSSIAAELYQVLINLADKGSTTGYSVVCSIVLGNSSLAYVYDELTRCNPSGMRGELNSLRLFIDDIRTKAKRNVIIGIARELQEHVERGFDPDDMREYILESLDEATEHERGLHLLGHVAAEALNRKEAEHFSTGGYFPLFDKCLHGGIVPGHFYILAARPGVGKSAFSLKLGYLLARTQVPVGMFQLEMTKEDQLERLFCLLTKQTLTEFYARREAMQVDKRSQLHQVIDKLNEQDEEGKLLVPFYIDDNPHLTMDMLRARARKLVHAHGVRVIIVDYLQLMSIPQGKNKTRAEAISEVSRSLKLLAKELNVAIVALSQLNREIERRNSNEPTLSDLRESGSLEQDADAVVFLYRPDAAIQYDDGSIMVNVKFGKNRHGPICTIDYQFKGDIFNFRENKPKLEF